MSFNNGPKGSGWSGSLTCHHAQVGLILLFSYWSVKIRGGIIGGRVVHPYIVDVLMARCFYGWVGGGWWWVNNGQDFSSPTAKFTVMTFFNHWCYHCALRKLRSPCKLILTGMMHVISLMIPVSNTLPSHNHFFFFSF